MSTGKNDEYGSILAPPQYFQRSPSTSNKFLIIGALVTVALLVTAAVLMGMNKRALGQIQQDLQLLQLRQLLNDKQAAAEAAAAVTPAPPVEEETAFTVKEAAAVTEKSAAPVAVKGGDDDNEGLEEGEGTGELSGEEDPYENEEGGARRKKWGVLCSHRSDNCGEFNTCSAKHCHRYFWKCNENNGVFSTHVCKCM